MLAAVDRFGVEAGLFGDVDEGDAERGSGNWRRRTLGGGAWLGVVGGAGAYLGSAGGRLRRLREGEDVFEREDEGRAGERGEECAAGPGQRVLSPCITRRPDVRDLCGVKYREGFGWRQC